MLVKLSIDEWLNDISTLADVHKAGQEADGSIIYAIVPDSTSTTGEVLEDMPSHIMQELYSGRFGEYMSLEVIHKVQEAIDYLFDEDVAICQTLNDLLYMRERAPI